MGNKDTKGAAEAALDPTEKAILAKAAGTKTPIDTAAAVAKQKQIDKETRERNAALENRALIFAAEMQQRQAEAEKLRVLPPIMQAVRAEVARRWDLPALHAAVIASQQRRHWVYDALRTGRYTSWDFQPIRDAGRQYVRNDQDLGDLEAMARFPPFRA